METKVIIPAMGESISSGILAAWHVKSGDYVEEGQAIFELETDKITSEANAEVSGVLTIKVEADEEVEIGQVVAIIDQSASGTPNKESEAPAVEEAAPSPEATPQIQTEEKGVKDFGDKLSPAARKAAVETGADLPSIAGTGKDGRLTKHDILSAPEKISNVKPSVETPPATPSPKPSSVSSSDRETRKRMTPLRKRLPRISSMQPNNPQCSRHSTKLT